MKEEISLLLKDLIRLKKHAEDDTEKLDAALEAEHRLHARNLIIRRKIPLKTKIYLIVTLRIDFLFTGSVTRMTRTCSFDE